MCGPGIRFRGQEVKADQSHLSVNPLRINSCSANITTAMRFAGNEGERNDGGFHVFLVTDTTPIIDIATFQGSLNPELVCYKNECETMLKPGCEFLRLTLEEVIEVAVEDPEFRVSGKVVTIMRMMDARIWRVKPPP